MYREWNVVPAIFVVLAAIGCTSGDTGSSDSATPAVAAAEKTDAPVGNASGAAFAFTDADLDAFERGLAKETELVKAAKARESAATTPEERGLATQAQWKEQTAPEAAKSLGVSPERYAQTRETVNRVLETLDFQGKIDGPLELDTARAAPEMRQRLMADPFAELAPSSAAALRARLDRIVPVWVEYVRLTAVAG